VTFVSPPYCCPNALETCRKNFLELVSGKQMKKNSSAGENGDSPSIKSGVAPLCRKEADGRKIISGKSSLFDPRSSDRPKFLYRHSDNANKNAHSEDTEEDSLETELGDVFDLASVSRVLDKFFFLWHTSMMMACLALVIVGVVLRFHFTSIVLSSVKKNVYYHEYEKFVAFRSAPKELNFGNLTQTLGNALMILNALHILCIMMYMSFQIHRNHFTLPVVCFLSGIVVILEINTTHVYMSTNSAPIKKAMKELTNKINSSYAVEDSNVISVTHDIFAIW
ncbi:polyprotein, partial [Biomphalaria glabrata]